MEEICFGQQSELTATLDQCQHLEAAENAAKKHLQIVQDENMSLNTRLGDLKGLNCELVDEKQLMNAQLEQKNVKIAQAQLLVKDREDEIVRLQVHHTVSTLAIVSSWEGRKHLDHVMKFLIY